MDAHSLQLMLGLGLLLVVSVLASKPSSKFGIPILLIFIGLGMFSGSEGPIGIEFHDHVATQILGTVALIYILFSGGLSTRKELIIPVWKEGVVLATLGVVVSNAIMAAIIHFTLGWSWLQAGLISATFSSTDAAAVFGILKTQNLGLKKKMQAILELESGSNDPMAVYLTVAFIFIINQQGDFTWGKTVLNFMLEMSAGGLVGWLCGKGMVKLINWLQLEYEGLYPVLTLSGVICIYCISEYLGGNGFLSVYLAGLIMGNSSFIAHKTLGFFHDGVAWLMQVAMFLTLGLLVNPGEIPPVLWSGVFISVALMLIARPLSVYLCLLPFRYKPKEIFFLSWGGLRGAVPIILATYFLVEDVPNARPMFNTVFLVVVITMLIQGSTMRVMARLTGVQEKKSKERKLPFKSRSVHSEFIEFYIPSSSHVIDQTILQMKLPKDVLVVLIHRQGDEFIPRGNTKIAPQDRLVCLAGKNSIPEVEAIFGSEHFKETKVG